MITLYTTHCPKCNILKKKLNEKHIEFTECEDVQEMLKLGMRSAPHLKVEDKLYDFKEANEWLNGVE